MKLSDQDKRVIEQYTKDEEMMILIYAQWCVNHDIDALELYKKAYPYQLENKTLQGLIGQTVAKEESEEISTFTVLHVLQLFGNDDLAFAVQEASDANKRKHKTNESL